MLDQPAAFTLPSDAGDLVAVPGSPGRTTVVDFWATDCEPCKRSLPALAAKADAWKGEGIDLVLVGVLRDDEATESAKGVLQSWGVARPFLVDRGGAVQKSMNVAKIPATLVLDGGGTVRWVSAADSAPEQIEAAARHVAGK